MRTQLLLLSLCFSLGNCYYVITHCGWGVFLIAAALRAVAQVLLAAANQVAQ